MTPTQDTPVAPVPSQARPPAADQPVLPEEALPPGVDVQDGLTVIQICLIIMTAILVVGTATYLGVILQEVLIALFLYYAIKPGAEAIIRRHFPPWLAYMTLLAAALVVFVLLGQLIYANYLQVQDQLPEYEKGIRRLLERLGEENSRKLTNLFDQFTQGLLSWAGKTALSVLDAGVIIFFYVLFMILNGQKVSHRIRRAFSSNRAHQILLIAEKINLGMQQYMKIKTLTSLGLAVTMAPIMYMFGLKFWLLWSFLFFALNYITYIGALVALLPPILVGLLQFEHPWTAGAMGAFLVLNRLLWIDYLEIRYSGSQLNVDPLLILLMLAYWGYFWGVIGMILAVPMLTSLKIVLANIERTRPWSILLSDD